MSECVYLDYNATTPLEPEVLGAIHESLRDAWGNPSSSHSAGVRAKEVITKARQSVADLVHGHPPDIIFTSGGTETNNWVLNTGIQHFYDTYPGSKVISDGLTSGKDVLPHFITTNLEHDSIKLVLETWVRQGKADVTFVPASKVTGRVEASDVVAAICPTTCMVTVMTANNETGIIQPVAEIMSRVAQVRRDPAHEVPRILLHTDAAQALGKVDVDAKGLGVDYLTIVGHKFYGPRIGALYCREPGGCTPLYPTLYGGGQERNYRPGTENTGMIAGLGKASQMVVDNITAYQSHMRDVRDYLEGQLEKAFPGEVTFNGRYPGSARIPNTCNVSILGEKRQGNKVLALLKHTQASVGAACHSSTECRASPILVASGVEPAVAMNALRLSVGRHTTTADIDTVVSDIRQAVCAVDNS